jgi:uncharacterized CHY-type Zn-finger protein
MRLFINAAAVIAAAAVLIAVIFANGCKEHDCSFRCEGEATPSFLVKTRPSAEITFLIPGTCKNKICSPAYSRDNRTNICFAYFTYYTIVTITAVPCDAVLDAVERLNYKTNENAILNAESP